MAEKQNNLHEGHRARLKRRFLAEGIDNFEEHNILELLLFFGIPYKDTNATAHRLLERFGSIANVLDADIEELTKSEGVGENCATMLKLMPSISRIYFQQKEAVHDKYDNIEKIGKLFISKYRCVDSEIVYLLMLDNSFGIIGLEKLFEGSVNSAHISKRKIAEHVIKANASMAVIAHNHPQGIAIPSTDDIETTSSLLSLLNDLEIPLLEHVLVAGEDYTPLIYDSRGISRTLPKRIEVSSAFDSDGFYKGYKNQK